VIPLGPVIRAGGEAMGRRIDLSGAEIRGGDAGDGGPPIFLPRQTAASPLLALDIGGTLVKLVYTASCGGEAELRFAQFERRRLDECFKFIRAEGLLGCNGNYLAGWLRGGALNSPLLLDPCTPW